MTPLSIPVARPVLGEQEVQAAARAILSGWVTQGAEVAAFEREFAAYVGARHACAVSSCTTALHLALLALGAGPGDEVITVSHSFIATANAVRYCGAVPVFVDVDPGTFNMDATRVQRAISPRTRCILCVHQMGMPCDLRPILETARQHGLPVVEDAACAIGSEILWDQAWEKIGRPRGDVACFSFHPRKIVTTGDGGMLTTNNGDTDARFRLWRQHGMGVSDTVRHGAAQVVFENYPLLGYNYRMTDIQAAVGRVQLGRVEDFLARRRDLVKRYQQRLAELPGVGLPVQPPWARSNWQSFCVRLPDGCDQRRVMQFMLDQGVATRRGVMCAHREGAYEQEPWRWADETGIHEGQKGGCVGLARGEEAQARCIILPLFHQMTDAEQDVVVDALAQACRSASGPVS